jgi:hypothetical protein
MRGQRFGGLLARYRVVQGEFGVLCWSGSAAQTGAAFPEVLWDYDTRRIPVECNISDFEVVGLNVGNKRVYFGEFGGEFARFRLS